MSRSSSKTPELPPSEANDRQRIPRWLPITLLTVTTIALTVPAVLLWRQKQALRQKAPLASAGKQLKSAPPARRRPGNATILAQAEAKSGSSPPSNTTSNSSTPPPRRVVVRSSALRANAPSIKNSSIMAKQSQESSLHISLFDGPLLSLGALGVATGAVCVGAALGVWGIRKSLGVNNVDEFAARVRQLLRTHMPALSKRIYNSSSEAGDELSSNAREKAFKQPPSDRSHEWTWEAAEDRLREAFDRGGVGEWAECAIRELEAEEGIERRKRGL